jgi:hypothetical protein
MSVVVAWDTEIYRPMANYVLHQRLDVDRDSSVGIATHYGLDDRFPVVTRFSAPVQTCPGAHLASYKMATELFQRVKRPGRGVNHPPPFSAEVKERVELYLYSPSVPS